MLLVLFASLAHATPPPPTEEGAFQLDMVTSDMLEHSCEGGDLQACHHLGRRYEQGIGGVTVSAPDAARWYRKGCEAGVPIDCGLGANALALANDAAAYAVAQRGCTASDAVSCFVLGHLQLVGLGTAVDATAGLQRVVAACDAQVQNACAELGQLYAGAHPNVPADPARARPLLEPACAAKDWASCTWLGTLRLSGQGGPVDAPGGLAVLQGACDAGFGPACENLGGAYVQGVGVAADPQKSVAYLQKACDTRQGASCAQLATMALQGQAGLAADRAKAVGYLKRSCEYGYAPACEEADAACRSGATDACR